MNHHNGNVIEMIVTNLHNEAKPIDQEYFDWLTSQIELPPGNRTYNELFERMHNTEFIWMVPNDDNRVQDGLDLRTEFLNTKRRKERKRLIVQEVFGRGGATVLEVLIGLSRRVAFLTSGEAPFWAWQLVENLELDKMSDPLADGKLHLLDNILEDLIWRTYERNGRGGFFPLKDSPQDQTQVELWHQMNAYVTENQQL